MDYPTLVSLLIGLGGIAFVAWAVWKAKPVWVVGIIASFLVVADVLVLIIWAPTGPTQAPAGNPPITSVEHWIRYLENKDVLINVLDTLSFILITPEVLRALKSPLRVYSNYFESGRC
jgi:hypothetical protein